MIFSMNHGVKRAGHWIKRKKCVCACVCCTFLYVIYV